VLIFIDTFTLIYSRLYLDTAVRQGGERETRIVPPPDNQGMGGYYHFDYHAPPKRVSAKYSCIHLDAVYSNILACI